MAAAYRSQRMSTLAVFARADLHAALTNTFCRVVFALGSVNLVAGVAFGLGDWAPTFVVLDVVPSHFALAVWIVVVHMSGWATPIATGTGLVAKTIALALVAATMFTASGLAMLAVQLWCGQVVDLGLLVLGMCANLWSALHLAMLAVAMQALVGRRWLAVAATSIIWVGSNLAFEHDLLRLGAPIPPASGMNGFEPFLAPWAALGIYWTSCCILLLAAGRWVALRRGRRAAPRLGPSAFAVVWGAGAACLVSGAWILHGADDALATQPAGRPGVGRFTAAAKVPQPVYSRLDLALDLSPASYRLASRGTAIALNTLDVPIPDLYFVVPRPLEVNALTVTGDLLDRDGNVWHYRLNRPLEPGETLKVEFDLRWTAGGLVDAPGGTRLLANGTFLTTADVVPRIGTGGSPAFQTAPPITFRARIGTSLDQIAVTAGHLVRSWRENARAYFEYASESPIPPHASIHSARYGMVRGVRDGIAIEVFHNPAHIDHVPRMFEAGHRALAARRATAPYRHRVLRVVEVADYRPFRRFGLLGFAGVERAPVGVCTGMVLAFSERGVSTPPPTGSIPPRA